ncbi:mechanosensitive ion channel family protein [Anabaena sp. CCY 9402-a]|uniref:mechanosensitive ion channel family protein n=1 Tax=Anabaena sp. CCY 9402-a TaxID=3103867 RepID=UPI0039C61426
MMKYYIRKYCYKLIILAFIVFILIHAIPISYSQDKAPKVDQNLEAIEKIDGTPVVLGDNTLFIIKQSVGSFSSQERAKAVINRIETIANDFSMSPDNLQVSDQQDTSNIVLGEKLIYTITDNDAKPTGQTRQELARVYLNKIASSIKIYRNERSLNNLIKGAVYSLIATLILVITFKVFNQIFPRIINRIQTWQGIRIPALRIQNLELLPASRVSSIVVRLAKTLRLIIVLGVAYIYFSVVLSFFPWTKQLSSRLFYYLLDAIYKSWIAFLGYLPNIFYLAVICISTYYVIKFIRYLFTELGNGTISFPGFYQDWAEPTYKLVFFLIIALALVLAFPYLPGFGSPAFQGISVFLGILFSLGSSSVIANIVAGIILIYTRAFQTGDRIKIGDAVGDIIEKNLFVTRIRTIKNVVITIPNGTVLTSQIINYSALAQDSNYYLVLHTTVTLGYDVPWRKVHQVLIDAALVTKNVLAEPQPFVLQTSLDDFYVSYELNIYTNKPMIMARIYSQLHQNIQDKCNEADIEILSPHYSALRDGNQITIPENYLPKDYKAPGFRLSTLDSIIKPSNGKDISETHEEG